MSKHPQPGGYIEARIEGQLIMEEGQDVCVRKEQPNPCAFDGLADWVDVLGCY